MKKRIVRFILIGVLAAAVIVVLTIFLNRSQSYQKAIAFESAGDRQSAYGLYRKLGTYQDSSARLDALVSADPVLPMRSAQKGDPVTFGRYEQDNDPENGPEPIQWLVLDRIENRLLLLSLHGLDGRPYHSVPFAETTWEDCELRGWLNEEFLKTAFSESEQAFIPTVLNQNRDQSAVGTQGGADTLDRVFLLSETEVSIYINNEMNRESIGKAFPTDYAAAHHVEIKEEGTVFWWLRSPGVYPYSAQFVDQNGELHLSGAYVDIDYQFAVRPAIWVELNKIEQEPTDTITS